MDENGTYVAQYQRVADGLTIRKEKLRYRSSYGDQVQHRILQSDTTFELDAERRLAKVVAKEGVAATSSMPVPEMSSTLQLKLQLVGVGHEAVNPVWLSDLARAERVLLSEPGTKSSVDAELDAARASKLSAEQALLRLRSTLGDKLEARAEAYNALMSHVRLDPKLVGQLLEHIQKHGPLSKDLISVLRDAGTPEAQAALRQLLQENDLPAGERLQVVRGLSRVDQPTAETVQALKGLIDDPVLGEQAQYGLGGNAYRLQESNPGLAKEAVTVIQTRLQNAPDDPTRQIALEALGNAGVPDTLPAVQEQLNSPTQGVQVSATQALRRIPGASVDMLLAKQLREASVPQVRIAAAEAIRYREPTPILVTALAESLRLEPVVQVRRSSMDIVAYFADRSSVLRESLRQAAQTDPDPTLRERAQTYLKH
jgi:HEAT repeat protein